MSENASWQSTMLAALRTPGQRPHALEALERLTPAEAAARIDPTVAASLTLLLGDPSRTHQRQAADRLAPLAPHAPALRDALRSALGALDPRLRWGAAYTLGHALRPPEAEIWPAVREALSLEDGDQRWAAAELTCDLARAHPEIRREILETVARGTPTLRRMLLYCLRDLGDADLSSVVQRRLGDEDPGVRLAALSATTRASADLGASEGLAHTVAALVESDPEPGVRRAAAATLGRLGIRTLCVLEALEKASAAGDPSLERAAQGARRRLDALSGRN